MKSNDDFEYIKVGLGKPLCTINYNCYDQPTADNLYNQKKILKQQKLMTPASEFLVGVSFHAIMLNLIHAWQKVFIAVFHML